MAGWEEELAVLLRELGVTQEEPDTHLHLAHSVDDQAPLPEDDKGPGKPKRDDTKWRSQAGMQSANSFRVVCGARFNISDDLDEDIEDDEPWLTDLNLMRQEVDSIVEQVIRLMQRGDLDPSLKEDVLVVLRALRRRAAVTQQAAASDEAYLEFASAMLHFCRLVLRLSEPAIEE